MHKVLVFAILVTTLSFVASVKEWKNFENGKVYSRTMTNEKKEAEIRASPRGGPVVEERLLHSHHRDKSRRLNSLQTTDEKPTKGRNPERHHRKSIEEEMHLKPLNERHHKFPNPELLDKSSGFNDPDSKVSRHTFLQQVRRKQNRRRARGGKRLKRNKSDHKGLQATVSSEIKPETTKGKSEALQGEMKTSNAKTTKNESAQYTQIRKEVFPVKQTSYW